MSLTRQSRSNSKASPSSLSPVRPLPLSSPLKTHTHTRPDPSRAVHHGKFFTTPPEPYYCLGFLFDGQLAYVSDVSHIPDECWDVIARHVRLNPLRKELDAVRVNGNGNGREEDEGEKPRLKALVIDCLRVEPFTSHFGIGQAVHAAQRFGAERTYLVSPSLSPSLPRSPSRPC